MTATDALIDIGANLTHDSFDADDGDYYADYGAAHDLYGCASIDYNYQQII